MEDVWETHKENIRRLYINEDKTCQQVAAEMRAEYGFEAKIGQYQRQFGKWKFRKCLTESEWKSIGRRIQKRKTEQNKESELRINGIIMDRKKIKKALSRYSETTTEKAQRQATSRRSRTPEGIVIATPPQPESLGPLSFPVYVENLPCLRFQEVLLKGAPVFDQLLLSFRRLGVREDYSQNDFIILSTPTSGQGSSSSALSALLDMILDNNPRLTDAYPTVPPSFLRKFITVLLEVANNFDRFRHIGAHATEMVLNSLQFSEGRAIALKLLGEHSAVFEALVGLLFQYAICDCNIELIKFLLQHSHIGPNDRLRFERLPLFCETSQISSVRTPTGFSEAITPAEYAIKHCSGALLRVLRQYGATFNIQGRRVKTMLRGMFKNSFEEVISFILDEGLIDIINNSEILENQLNLFRKEFREVVQDDSMQYLPAEEPPEEKPPEEKPPEGNPPEGKPPGEEPPAEELLEWSVRNENMRLTELLLEQQTAITEATFLCAIQCGNLHVVNRALEAGTNVNTISALGTFPLKIAAERGDLSVVQTLLRHGAEIEPATSCSPIFWSIPSHEIIKLFLKKGVDVHVLDNDGVSPLCHFLLRHDPDTAMFLIDWGVCLGRHPKRTPLWVPTPLQIAARMGYDAVVEKLLDRNVDVNEEAPLHGHDVCNRPNVQVFYGDTALAGAIRNSWGRHTRIIDRLINKGANPNVVSRYGDTPLSMAIDHGDEAAVQSLLKAGASLVDSEAFRAAAASGNIDFLRQSLNDGLCLDNAATFALSSAVHSCRMHPGFRVNTVSFLIKSGARANGIRLAYYFVKQNVELSRLLLSHGACIVNSSLLECYWNFRASGNTSELVKILKDFLSMPSRWGELLKSFFLYRQLCSAAIMGDFDLTKALIDAGIDVASLRTDVKIEAAYYDYRLQHIAKLFSRCPLAYDWLPPVQSSDPPRKEPEGEHTAHTTPQYFMPTQLKFPRTENTKNESNSAVPLPQFQGKGSNVDLLLEHTQSIGSSANTLLDLRYDLEPYRISRAEILELEFSDPNRHHLRKMAGEILLYAAIKGGPAIIGLLHEAGIDVNGKTRCPHSQGFLIPEGRALQYAIRSGSYASADALIQVGADVNAPANEFCELTALQAAAIQGHIGIACKLLEKGADVNAPGGSFGGRTALEGAAESGRLDTVQLLLDNGADITDSAFGEAQYRNSTKFAKDEGYPAISRLIKRHRLSMGYPDLSCDDSV